jgi:hypothetical protein
LSLLVADCPRCGAKKITFDVKSQVYRYTSFDWALSYEIFCLCRACLRPTTFLVNLTEPTAKKTFEKDDALVKAPGALNNWFKVDRFIGLRDVVTIQPPEHLPKDLEAAFKEGAA